MLRSIVAGSFFSIISVFVSIPAQAVTFTINSVSATPILSSGGTPSSSAFGRFVSLPTVGAVVNQIDVEGDAFTLKRGSQAQAASVKLPFEIGFTVNNPSGGPISLSYSVGAVGELFSASPGLIVVSNFGLSSTSARDTYAEVKGKPRASLPDIRQSRSNTKEPVVLFDQVPLPGKDVIVPDGFTGVFAGNGAIESIDRVIGVTTAVTTADFLTAGGRFVNRGFFWNLLGEPLNPPKKKDSDEDKPASGQFQPEGKIDFNGLDLLSFTDILVDTALLDGGIPSLEDPILGAEIIIDDTILLGPSSDGEGWFFQDTALQFVVEGVSVLTADLVDAFLFSGGSPKAPMFDSEFQAVLDNIVFNNTINSDYLTDYEVFIDAGGLSHFSFPSNILAATENLTSPGSSEGKAWVDGTEVPEPSLILGLLALGTLGTASTLKDKLKKSKSKERELEKVC